MAGEELIEAAPPAFSSRTLIIVDFSSAPAEKIVRYLGLGLADVSLRMRRRGYQLFRVLPIHEGETLVAELRRQGFRAWSLPAHEIAAARRPLVVRGGDPATGQLVLVKGDALRVNRDGLLIACHGRIHREREARLLASHRRGRTTAVLEEGHRIHLHRRDNLRPLEIDPGAFEFGDTGAAPSSSLLRIRLELAQFAADLAIDEAFRFEPPALAPVQPERQGLFGVVSALRTHPDKNQDPSSTMLNNLEQFRFYSAWRGALERVLRSD